MCIYNRLMKNRKYTKTKKNGGIVPPLPDRRIEYVAIGCGNCMECRKQKANEWRVRLMEDIKFNKHAKFIALTFSDESIKQLVNQEIRKTNSQTGAINTVQIATLKGYERDNAIATRAVKLFRERWRKEFGKSIRHWLVTELGHNGTENIHLHGIVWTEQPFQKIREHWQYGFIYPRPHEEKYNYVAQDSISYIVKYVSKIDKKHKEYKQIILNSAGIGGNIEQRSWAKKIQDDKHGISLEQVKYKTTTGHEIGLPTYWRNKLLTEEQREQLWIKQLDKEERWVDGVKYDISKGDKEYKKAVQEARRINKELGYGGLPNENRKEYEEQLRDIKVGTRLQRAQKLR